MKWRYRLPGDGPTHPVYNPPRIIDSADAPKYGITLDPNDVEAARAMCLHIHGRFPEGIWVDTTSRV